MFSLSGLDCTQNRPNVYIETCDSALLKPVCQGEEYTSDHHSHLSERAAAYRLSMKPKQ